MILPLGNILSSELQQQGSNKKRTGIEYKLNAFSGVDFSGFL